MVDKAVSLTFTAEEYSAIRFLLRSSCRLNLERGHFHMSFEDTGGIDDHTEALHRINATLNHDETERD